MTERSVERLATSAWTGVFALGVLLDAYLLGHGLVKMEAGNAAQLAYHALARGGVVVLASPPGYFADALHHWFFHALLLLSPRPEAVSACLNAVFDAGLIFFFLGARRRLGTVAAAVAASLLAACPVTAVLSKHVISTSLVPLAGAFFVFAFLDFSAQGSRESLGACVAWLAVLVALNHAHAWLAVPLAWQMRRRGGWRAPSWAWAAALAASSSGLVGLAWSLRSGAWTAWGPALLSGGHYQGPVHFLRRLFLIEWRLNDMLPNLDLLFGLAAWAGWTLWRRRREAPAGLAALLLYAAALPALNGEAVVFWQLPFCLLVGWAASKELRLAAASLVYALAAMVSYQGLFLLHGDEPNFFVLSSVRERYRVMDVLRNEMGLRAGELERLTFAAKDDDETDGGEPPLRAGFSYIARRVEPPLPPGGDRCFSVSDGERPLPPGASLDRRVERYGLVFQSWRGGPPCPGNALRPQEPAVLGLDLKTARVLVVRPEGS